MTDFHIRNEGSIVLFAPISPDAQEHAAIWLADATWLGNAACVEPRYALPIIEDLIEHGFELEAV